MKLRIYNKNAIKLRLMAIFVTFLALPQQVCTKLPQKLMKMMNENYEDNDDYDNDDHTNY